MHWNSKNSAVANALTRLGRQGGHSRSLASKLVRRLAFVGLVICGGRRLRRKEA